MPQKLKYSEENVGLVKTSIDNLIRTNSEYAYSVKVSGLVIVPRTRDISIFDSFRDHVGEETESVTFTNYYGKGNAGETITLYTGEIPPEEKEKKSMDGVPATSSTTDNYVREMAERSELRRQIFAEIQNEFLTKENARLKRDLDKAEKYVRDVDVIIGQLTAQRDKTKDKSTWELLSGIITRLVATNPQLMEKSPVIGTLLGILPGAEETQSAPPPPAPPVESVNGVTIKAKPQSPSADPQTEQLLAVLKKLRRHFSEIEFDKLIEMLADCAKHKELIDPVCAWVKQQIDAKLQWIERQRAAQQQQDEPEPDEPEQTDEPQTEPEHVEQPEIGATDTTRDEAKQYPDYDILAEPGVKKP